MITKGQLLSQSGFKGCSSGQQGMSPAISAIVNSAAIVLTGAISIPRRANSDKRRTTAEKYFIATMIDTERATLKGAHGNLQRAMKPKLFKLPPGLIMVRDREWSKAISTHSEPTLAYRAGQKHSCIPIEVLRRRGQLTTPSIPALPCFCPGKLDSFDPPFLCMSVD